MGDGNLASFIEDVCGEGHLRVETDLGGGFVRLRSSEAERRQAAQDIRSSEDIIIEMLRNARDAHASNIFVACTREGSTRRIVMIDDGDGVPKHLQRTVFEPRVTSKLDSMHMDKWGVHGRGMALYSIAVNAESATISASDSGLGSAFVIQTDLHKLPEKTDQSSFPTFELNEAGTVAVRGPKNILRTACEFAIESRTAVNVFIGSSTDIAATLYAFGLGKLSAEDRLSGENDPRLPICKRLSACSSLSAFHQTAESLGLLMSERSARRILDGQIAPLSPLLAKIKIDGLQTAHALEREGAESQGKTANATSRHAKGLKLADEDAARFARQISQAYAELADAYYLDANIEPHIRVSKDAIRITIPVLMQS